MTTKRDDIFWHRVKEHYSEKKKKLMSCTDIESEDYMEHIINELLSCNLDITYLDKLKSMTSVEELKEELKKYKYTIFDDNNLYYEKENSNDELKYYNKNRIFRYIRQYIKLLIYQLIPLLPPYSEDEMKELTKNLHLKGLALPDDVYDYYTKVSRELLIFNDLPYVLKNIDINGFNHNKIVKKIDKDREPEYYGFYIGHSGLNIDGSSCCSSHGKFCYLKPNKLWSSVWVDTDDGHNWRNPSYILYAKTFSGLIDKKMRKENNNDYDRNSNLYDTNFNSCNKYVEYNENILINPDFDKFDDNLDDEY